MILNPTPGGDSMYSILAYLFHENWLLFWKESLRPFIKNGPFSYNNPISEEHPGPPLNQITNGSVD